jgi:hypothetical protein
VFGLIDWWAIPSGTRAKAIGLWHGVGNVVVVPAIEATMGMRLLGRRSAVNLPIG